MADGLLEKCDIYDDVTKMNVSGMKASVVTAGFPCQAYLFAFDFKSSCLHSVKFWFCVRPTWCREYRKRATRPPRMTPEQAWSSMFLSTLMLWKMGARLSSLPRMAPSLFEFCGFVFQSPGMRRAIFLENVAALRSKPLKSLWQWLLQVPVLGHEFAMAAGGCPY